MLTRNVAGLVLLHVVSFINLMSADTTSMQIQPWVAGGLYGAQYSSAKGDNEWYDLACSAPLNGGGLNLLAIGLRAESPTVFGAVALQYGDVPLTSWDLDVVWLQEAWIGYHISDEVDISMGAYISPFGVETVNGFENYSSITSVVSFFDPACHAGVQASWNVADDVSLTGGVVTSYSSFRLSSDLPSLLAVLSYGPDEDSYVLQALLSTEESDTARFQQLYTNVASVVHYGKTHTQVELNMAYAFPTDVSVASVFLSGLLAAYVDVADRLQTGLRLEGVYDPSGMMSAIRAEKTLPDPGLAAAGVTASLTYALTEWAKLRLDGRYLGALDQTSIIQGDPDVRERTDIVLCVDVMLPLLSTR
jgi:hypothetical protein